MRTKAQRRFTDRHKALRKRRIVNDVYRWNEGWYDNLHQYSKNKVHCSCAMCRGKIKNKQLAGPAECWPMRDVKHFVDMDQQLNDYDEGEIFEDEPEDY